MASEGIVFFHMLRHLKRVDPWFFLKPIPDLLKFYWVDWNTVKNRKNSYSIVQEILVITGFLDDKSIN